jgi:chemotaxis protein MotB
MNDQSTETTVRVTMDERRFQRASWIITYGDMITLLLTFFVMTLVILNEAENNIYRMINQLLSETEQNLQNYIVNHNQLQSFSVQRGTKGVQITISSGAIFDVNKAEIKPDIANVLRDIGNMVRDSRLMNIQSDPELSAFAEAIRRGGGKLNVEIRVEGHTDSDPVRSGEYKNNWELSSARALAVVQFLSKNTGIPEKVFSALGYGPYQPIASNTTEGGKAKNRRVEIFIDADVITD